MPKFKVGETIVCHRGKAAESEAVIEEVITESGFIKYSETLYRIRLLQGGYVHAWERELNYLEGSELPPAVPATVQPPVATW